MPYCTTCGIEVTEEMLFCPQCGRKVISPKAGFKDDKIRAYPAQIEEPADTPSPRIKRKLYKQWVAHAGLPADSIPPTRTSRGLPVGGEGNRRSLASVQVLLGICIGAGGTALVFLLT